MGLRLLLVYWEKKCWYTLPTVDCFAGEDLVAFGGIRQGESHQGTLSSGLGELEVVDLGLDLHLTKRTAEHKEKERDGTRRFWFQYQLEKKPGRERGKGFLKLQYTWALYSKREREREPSDTRYGDGSMRSTHSNPLCSKKELSGRRRRRRQSTIRQDPRELLLLLPPPPLTTTGRVGLFNSVKSRHEAILDAWRIYDLRDGGIMLEISFINFLFPLFFSPLFAVFFFSLSRSLPSFFFKHRLDTFNRSPETSFEKLSNWNVRVCYLTITRECTLCKDYEGLYSEKVGYPILYTDGRYSTRDFFFFG